MKLSELNLPPSRREEIKDICKIFNAQSCAIVEHTFADIGRKSEKCTTSNPGQKAN
jgi:hypothetical protein